jgi:CCR4-NOT transcription complex subunit 4
MRVSTGLPPVTSLVSGGPTTQNPDTSDNTQVLVSDVVSNERYTHDVNSSMIDEESWEVYSNAKLKPTEWNEQFVDGNCPVVVSNTNAEIILDTPPIPVTSGKLPAKGINQNIAASSTGASSIELTQPSYGPGFIKDGTLHADGIVHGSCSGLSSISIHNHFKDRYSGPVGQLSDHTQMKGSQQDYNEHSGEASMSTAFMEAARMEDFLGLDDQRLKGVEGIHRLPSISCSPCPLQDLNQSSCQFWQHGEASNQGNLDVDPRIVCMKHEEIAYPLTSKSTGSSYGFNDNKTKILADLGGTFGSSSVFSEKGLGHVGAYEERVPSADYGVTSDMGESSIISNILSLDINAWEDSLTSPHTLVKLLSENGKQHGYIKSPNLPKAQDKNQSRFSFARQEDVLNQVSALENSLGSTRHLPDEYVASHDFMEKKDPCIDTYQNIFSSSSSLQSDKFPGSDPFTTSKLPREYHLLWC